VNARLVAAELRRGRNQGSREDSGESPANGLLHAIRVRGHFGRHVRYSDRPSVDKHNSMTLDGERIRALTELMRWTGLRIRDAVTLERAAFRITRKRACTA
jgi:hypothetical protein